jgi:hypothetical protein
MASDSQVGYKTIQQNVASSSKLVGASTSKLASEVNLSLRSLPCLTNNFYRTRTGRLQQTTTSNQLAHNWATCAKPRRLFYPKGRVRMSPLVRHRSRDRGNTMIDGSVRKIARLFFGRTASKDTVQRDARSSKHLNRLCCTTLLRMKLTRKKKRSLPRPSCLCIPKRKLQICLRQRQSCRHLLRLTSKSSKYGWIASR